MTDSNNMTDKTKCAINDATDLAEEESNIQLEPVHIAVVLFGEKEIGGRMCTKVIVPPRRVRDFFDPRPSL